MRVGVPKEEGGERRVALVPRDAKALIEQGHEVVFQANGGRSAGFADRDYEEAGAERVDGFREVFEFTDLVVKVGPLSVEQAGMLRAGGTVAGLLAPLDATHAMKRVAEKEATALCLEFLPRITRAQSMDALSSMSTVSGYKAALLAADTLPRFFPLLMTAAGTMRPASALVIGAGVAGLQAIASCRRLGARVKAFDVRPATREQVESIGARFLEMDLEEDSETRGGYAGEMTEKLYRKELEVIGGEVEEMDVVIATALIFGKKAPILVTEEMVEKMRPGSVIVDLAAPNGGNCEAAEPGSTIVKHGVTIHAPLNLAASLPQHASQMYSKNISTYLKELWKEDGGGDLDFGNEIVDRTCLIYRGEVRNDKLRERLGGKQGG